MAAAGQTSSDRPWVWEELDESAPVPEAPTEPPTVEEAVASVEDLVHDAFQEGFERGVVEGERRAREELEVALASLGKAIDGVHGVQRRMLADVEENAAALAIGVARELVVNELDAAPETVAELVREAVSSFALDAALAVRLNPTDLALITAGGDTVVSGSREVRWEPDPKIGRGGCLVEGPGKIVDGRLDLALERIYRVISGD